MNIDDYEFTDDFLERCELLATCFEDLKQKESSLCIWIYVLLVTLEDLINAHDDPEWARKEIALGIINRDLLK